MFSAQVAVMLSEVDDSKNNIEHVSAVEVKSSNSSEVEEPSLKDNRHYQKILELRRDRIKLGYALADSSLRQFIPVVFALKTGVPILKIKGVLQDPNDPVIERAKKFIENACLEKLKLYFKIKEIAKQKNEEQLVLVISSFIQQLGNVQELQNALGSIYQKSLIEKAIKNAKAFSDELRTVFQQKAKDLDYIIGEFQSSFELDKSLDIENTRNTYISILSDLKKSYDQTTATYNKEIEIEHNRYRPRTDELNQRQNSVNQLHELAIQVREEITYDNSKKAYEKYRASYKEHIAHMIMTLKEIRETYPKDAKETMSQEFLFKHLPIGTAFGWLEKIYKTKKPLPMLEAKGITNLLDMKQIEQDLDVWLKASHGG